jgi:predicted site-specific integrase-resolvase
MGRKTPVAARELGVAATRLHSILRSGKMPLPMRDSSGDFIWTDTDLTEAKRAMTIDRRRSKTAGSAHGS